MIVRMETGLKRLSKDLHAHVMADRRQHRCSELCPVLEDTVSQEREPRDKKLVAGGT